MPIKLGRIPQSLRSGNQIARGGLASNAGGTQDEAFQRAKVSAGRWATAGIDNPNDESQNAPPWYAGRPFSVSRTENPDVFRNWKSALQTTYPGYEFGAPQPEPSKPADTKVAEAKPAESIGVSNTSKEVG